MILDALLVLFGLMSIGMGGVAIWFHWFHDADILSSMSGSEVMAVTLNIFQYIFAVACLGYVFRMFGQWTRGWNFSYKRQVRKW